MEEISVIVPTKGGGAKFKEQLAALDDQRVDANVEIVVVDSGSTDGTVDVAREYDAKVTEVPPQEFHHARTRNLAARQASGDVLVFTVQDAVPDDERWLTELVVPLEDTEVGAAYGRQIAHPDAKPMDDHFYSYFYPDEDIEIPPEAASNPRKFYLENVFVSDVSAAVRSDVFRSVEFREDVGMSEDKEFALRLLEEGYHIVYRSSAVVKHSHDYSLGDLAARRYKDGAAYKNIARHGEAGFLKRGVRYELSHLAYLLPWHAHWVPYAIMYDLVHALAFQLGENQEHLPGAIRRRLGGE